MKSIDITNKTFGNLHVIGREFSNKRRRAVWKCICGCGNECFYTTWEITSGHVLSCGCRYRKSKKMIEAKIATPKNKTTGIHAIETQIYNQCRKNASSKNREFALSKDEVIAIINKPCYYCGEFYTRQNRRTGVKFDINGIDRVDSSKGYIKGNCVPCCRTCNLAKNTMTVLEFRRWIAKVYHHYLGSEEI